MSNVFIGVLEAGGTSAAVLAVAGLASTCWGVFNLFRPPREWVMLCQLALSFLPGVLGLWHFMRIYSSYELVALSPTVPTKPEFDVIMSAAISIGIASLVCSLIPIAVGVLALVASFEDRMRQPLMPAP